jgi:predicted nucleic acid-binding OB-fold protein
MQEPVVQVQLLQLMELQLLEQVEVEVEEEVMLLIQHQQLLEEVPEELVMEHLVEMEQLIPVVVLVEMAGQIRVVEPAAKES